MNAWVSFCFAAKQKKISIHFFFFCLHRMLNSVRIWRLRGRKRKRKWKERKEKTRGVFSILLYARNVTKNLNLWFTIVGLVLYVWGAYVVRKLGPSHSITILLDQPFWCVLFCLDFWYARGRKITDTNVFNLHWNNLFFCFVLFYWWMVILCDLYEGVL